MPLNLSRLGRFGQFGNQICQYWAGKALARRNGCRLHVPADWIGRQIFLIDDPPIEQELPSSGFDELIPPNRNNVDLLGYFQHPDFFGLYTEADARRWTRLQVRWEDWRRRIPNAIRAHRRSYRGYEGVFCVVSERSYQRASASRGLAIDEWISDFTPGVNRDFPGEFPFLWDFLRLMRSSILFRGNSTFSWAAAILGQVPTVYAPLVYGLAGPQEVEFAYGNHWSLVDLRRNCPDEPGRVSGPYQLRETPWPG